VKTLVLPDDHDLCIRAFLAEITALRNRVPPRGVLHVGAHMGEEVPAYRDHRYGPIWLVEANPEVIPKLAAKFEGANDVRVIDGAIGAHEGSVEFIVHRTKKGGVESSGVLPLARLGEIVPVFDSEVRYDVAMTTIDTLVARESIESAFDLLVLDIQGAEKQALDGASRTLAGVRFVICEVNLIANYRACALEHDIDAVFTAHGFAKQLAIYHELYDARGRFPAWGECLWMNTKNLK